MNRIMNSHGSVLRSCFIVIAFAFAFLSLSSQSSFGQCTTNLQCHNDNNVCTCDRCVNMSCQHNLVVYGNTNCDLAPFPNLDDILCTLNGFSNIALCPNADIRPNCTGNNLVNLEDILATLNAFAGFDPCSCATGFPCDMDEDCDDGFFCNGVEMCVTNFCQAGSNPCPGQECSETGDVCTGTVDTVISCQLASPTAPRGTTVKLNTFVESVTSLAAYQVAIEITKLSGPGSITVACPNGVQINTTRSDFVFLNQSPLFSSVDCIGIRAAAALQSTSVSTTPPKYLADFTLNVSPDSSSCTVYEIVVSQSPGSLLRSPTGGDIPFLAGGVCTLQITGDSGIDCNNNDIPDECEADCQPNGVADECDLDLGTSDDCNTNDIPDECEMDCQPNGSPDDCDVVLGTSDDCNANDIPDECESPDCQPNNVPDECDIAGPTSTDCNLNAIPDECDLALGVGTDCQPNGVFDLCEIIGGSSQDFNSNGIPDECDALCAAGCGDNNACTCDSCLNGICSHTNKKYGDVNCSGGGINLQDILCVLNGFANISTCRNGDIAPPCTGNGTINLDDILRVLSAFGGINLCGCT